MKLNELPPELLKKIRKGIVIPAVPLSLNSHRTFDQLHQRAILRYYIDAGVGGVAVGVHSTQFEIRDRNVGLFEPVLEFASNVVDNYCQSRGIDQIFKIAGVCGKTAQAKKEAEFAWKNGYHAGLLSLSSFVDEKDDNIVIDHCRQIAEIIPIIGFYLQPAVGGGRLPLSFWRKFVEIENVIAIKIAPFNRYYTLDVIRAVCECGREKEIALYTGNDDNIVVDLLTTYKIGTAFVSKEIRIVGGLLGHWAVWTKKTVELLTEIHKIHENKSAITPEMLTLAAQITEANAAIFDVANDFSGCIPGIHEVLRRQGLFEGNWCLNPRETLSFGQKEEIDRICSMYPHLTDEAFVKENLPRWFDNYSICLPSA
ncbi:MAG: dihydrodipicolinate synthase family protein [Planctomycetes bacterium GWC2_45_44]|nr:MAG: dihydrodipicolinate synthase family protein [Planctomycetes bacterium GWC2_45_44]